jgi:hypothetical protein
MSLHERCCGRGIGQGEGSLTGGEGRTLVGIIAGIEPEEVKSFISVILATCKECDRTHVLLDKDMGSEEALNILNNAIGLIIMGNSGLI